MTVWISIILIAHGAAPDAAPPAEESGDYVARMPNGTTICKFPEVPDAAYRVVTVANDTTVYGIVLDPKQNPFVLQKEMVEVNSILTFDDRRSSYRREDCNAQEESRTDRTNRRDRFVQGMGFEKLPAHGSRVQADRNTWVRSDQLAFAQHARDLARKEHQSDGEPLATALFAPVESGPTSETDPAGEAAVPAQDSPRFPALWGWHMLILAIAVALVGLVAYTTLLRHGEY